jgi:hypothetical protein
MAPRALSPYVPRSGDCREVELMKARLGKGRIIDPATHVAQTWLTATFQHRRELELVEFRSVSGAMEGCLLTLSAK